jgi:PPOX class probable F420-dependent enzyme
MTEPTGRDLRSDAMAAFWAERRLATLTTHRPDGRPHVVPVGVTLDPAEPLVRVITSRGSRKVRNVLAAGDAGAPVALCQVDGRHWVTVEGTAHVLDDPADVAEAVRLYGLRYRTPRPNPERVVIAVWVTHVMGNV